VNYRELKLQLPDEGWRSEAKCIGLTHLFFEPMAERPQARERREAIAKQVCSTCPSLMPCLEYAYSHNEQGIWGGKTEEERGQRYHRRRCA
jgi:WhiB family transcriptional regulator, redox-sensing transcriptional regulator